MKIGRLLVVVTVVGGLAVVIGAALQSEFHWFSSGPVPSPPPIPLLPGNSAAKAEKISKCLETCKQAGQLWSQSQYTESATQYAFAAGCALDGGGAELSQECFYNAAAASVNAHDYYACYQYAVRAGNMQGYLREKALALAEQTRQYGGDASATHYVFVPSGDAKLSAVPKAPELPKIPAVPKVPTVGGGPQVVNGYLRSDGTYVAPYIRNSTPSYTVPQYHDGYVKKDGTYVPPRFTNSRSRK